MFYNTAIGFPWFRDFRHLFYKGNGIILQKYKTNIKLLISLFVSNHQHSLKEDDRAIYVNFCWQRICCHLFSYSGVELGRWVNVNLYWKLDLNLSTNHKFYCVNLHFNSFITFFMLHILFPSRFCFADGALYIIMLIIKCIWLSLN